jgi:hypothetical protein
MSLEEVIRFSAARYSTDLKIGLSLHRILRGQ